MPWSVGDVDKHKKGLTPAQKKKWVKIANGVLKDCGKGSACEGKAIRVANSSFVWNEENKTFSEMVMGKKTEKMPQGALHFMDHGCLAKATSDGDKIKLDMVVYSGGVIKNHFWWGNLSIDLDGIKFPKGKFPVLENHEQSRKIGFTAKPLVNGNITLNPNKTEFVDTETANEFIKLSKAGFPYESSMYAIPSAIERLEQGASAEVNGMTVKGPATIWRQSVFKEASVCVFGWDSNTRSSAFATQEVELSMDVTQLQNTILKKEVKKDMDLTTFKAEHKDAYEELFAEIRKTVNTELQTKFDKDKADLDEKHTKELAKKDSQLEGQNTRLLDLEKRDAIRSEHEMRDDADKVWVRRLGNSNVPEHLYDKVMRHVSYTKFVKDGVLDREKFIEAIDSEIKDWETKGVTSTVLGSGFGHKETEGEETEVVADTKLVEDTTDTLLSLAGQDVKKDQK